MTDKQLERGNQIKKEIASIETLHNAGQFYLISEGQINDTSLCDEILKMQHNSVRRIDKMVADKLTALKKEFAKL